MLIIGRRSADRLTTTLMYLAASFVVAGVLVMGAGLLIKSWPILETNGLSGLLFSSAWRPSQGEFGFFPFIMGTLWVTGIAALIALPISILTAVYLAEYAHPRVRSILKPFMDVLAGIPSVVFGVWGILVLAIGGFNIGFNVLTGGIVLALMVVPVITSIAEESFRTVPNHVKEASLALGATKWEMVKHVVLRSSLLGIVAAGVMGFSRAFGETLAVLMVVGNIARVPTNPLDPGYPLPALIANNYGEMMSIPSYESALMFAALILFTVVVMFNAIARLVLTRLQERWA
ncbi:MAG: phosphate ABC transporter permease subunit PstC [Chloroflexi bacterium]|nr:phosphate ABC transporter permease subunit PstC [Chloroflexota bacterium]